MDVDDAVVNSVLEFKFEVKSEQDFNVITR